MQVLSLLLTNLDLQHILLNCEIIYIYFAEPGIAGLHLNQQSVSVNSEVIGLLKCESHGSTDI